MMFRPRESHDLRLLEHPAWTSLRDPARLRWLHDVFDNSVAIATFEGSYRGAALRKHCHPGTFRKRVARIPARRSMRKTYPFRYSDEELPNLARGLSISYPSDDVARWARQFLDPSGSHRDHESAARHDARNPARLPLPAPQRKGRAEPRRDAATRAGQLPGFRGPDDGGGAVAWASPRASSAAISLFRS